TYSSVASLAKLQVLEMAESVNSWKAACIWMCHSGVTSCAVTNTRCHVAGTSSKWMWPAAAIRCISASEYQPSCCARRTKSSLTSGISTPAWLRMKATAKSGSIPEEQPAMIEIVPVGATVVRLQFRSRRSGRTRSPFGPRAQVASGPQIDVSHSAKTPRCSASFSDATFASSSTNSMSFRPSATPLLHEQADVDGPQVADVVGKQRLLAAGVRGFVAAEARDRVVVVGPIDEVDTGLARPPCAVHDLPEHLARHKLAHRPAGTRIDEVVARALFHRPHERVRDGHRDVEVRHLGEVVLAADELEDVGMVHPQDAHVRAAAGAALFHHVGRGVVQLHERHGAGGNAHRRAHDVVLGSQPRE